MQCHLKDERLSVPEYIISIHLCKIESWFVAKTLYQSVFFHNLTTNIKVFNLKSLIDIAHYGNDDPDCMSWQVLCQCLSSYVQLRLAKKVFYQFHSKCKLKVGLPRYILFLSCLSQTKHPKIANTYFAREPYSLFMQNTAMLIVQREN